jgi:rubrerythrin
MASLKGSQTEKNLLAAFAGESQARNRYTFAASVARKAGFEQISALFLETAENEKEHGQVFWKHLEGGDVEITAAYPAGVTGDTLANLQMAAAGEKMESGTLYPAFAATAKEEGFGAVFVSFDQISKVEAYHEKRYNLLAARVANNQVFARETKIFWHCRNCGMVMEGTTPPVVCPACQHPQAFYEPWAENY